MFVIVLGENYIMSSKSYNLLKALDFPMYFLQKKESAQNENVSAVIITSEIFKN